MKLLRSCQIIDATALRCPMPLLMAKRAIIGMDQGDQVEVRSKDAGSARDFETFARLAGHMFSVQKVGDTFRLRLTKGSRET